MAKTSRSALFGAVARFREEDGPFFLPDNLKIAFSPSNAALKARFLRANPILNIGELREASQLGLGELVPVELRGSNRGLEICWTASGANFQQSLGHFGRHRNVTLTVDWNPIRAVRARLAAAQQRAHNEHVGNYLDRRVVGLVDAQRACFAAIEEAIPKWNADYRGVLQKVWGAQLEPEQVHVSLNLIELAWDALTPDTASLGARLFLHEWNTSIARAKHAFIVDRLEHDADGALRGIGASGEQLKLYRKTQDFPTNRTWRYPPHWQPFRANCRRRIYATRVRGARWFGPPNAPLSTGARHRGTGFTRRASSVP